MVLVRNRLLVRHAVAIDQRRSRVLVLDRTDSPVPMPAARFDQLTPVPLTRFDVFSAAGRLWVAERARADGDLTARWSPAAIHAAAVRAATASLGARRGAALDLVTLGLPDEPMLDLSGSELTWYRARAAARDGDARDLLRLLRDLPPDGYPGRVDLLLFRAADLFADAALAEGAGALLEPHVPTSPDAAALRAALRPAGRPDTPDVLRVYAPVAAGDDPQVDAMTRAIADGDALPGGARSSGPAMKALDTRLAPRAAFRADPAAVDDEAVLALGHVAELARRAYRAGDGKGLADLPDADGSVRHYRALHAYRTTGTLNLDDLRPAARATVSRTDELARAFPGRKVASAEVAADPSTWRFLLANAVDEKITLTDELRSTYPEFALWLALCATRTSLRDGRWNEVAATGERIAEQAGAAPLAAEARNVAAYARWQLGQPEQALALLDAALAAHPVEALAVNAALIAADRGGAAGPPADRGLEYLAEVCRLTAHPWVRRGALEHAIALSRATGIGYPATLAGMVRDALARPQDDDAFHRTLLGLSLTHDRVWLRSVEVTTTGPAQVVTARYFSARAAYAEDPSGDSLRDVAVAVVALHRHEPAVDGAGAELAVLVDELERALDAADPAVEPVPAVTALLAADVLPLRPRLTLAIRAGAHLAAAAEKRGRMLSTDAERRLILGPVNQFARRRDDLGRADRRAVEDALATHLRAAATSIVSVVLSGHTALVEHWRRLDRETATHRAERIAARKGEILDRLDRYLERCRPYLQAMEELPVDEQFQRAVRDVLVRLSDVGDRARRSLV